MNVTLEDLSQLMHDTYESSAIKYGWYADNYSRVSWAFVPEENRAAIRDAVALVEEAVREDERAKHGPEAIQSDIKDIMKVLGMSTHARSNSPHEVVQKEILPKIRRMVQYSPEVMQSDLVQIMSELGINAHARSRTPSELVQKEILPKIRSMRKTLIDVRAVLGRNYVEVKEILDKGIGS